MVDGRTADLESHHLIVPARSEIQSTRLLLPLDQRHDQHKGRESSDNVVFFGGYRFEMF
jgi:hypothetical protein